MASPTLLSQWAAILTETPLLPPWHLTATCCRGTHSLPRSEGFSQSNSSVDGMVSMSQVSCSPRCVSGVQLSISVTLPQDPESFFLALLVQSVALSGLFLEMGFFRSPPS